MDGRGFTQRMLALLCKKDFHRLQLLQLQFVITESLLLEGHHYIKPLQSIQVPLNGKAQIPHIRFATRLI